MRYMIVFLVMVITACASHDVSQYESGKFSDFGYQEVEVRQGVFDIQYGASRVLFSSKPSWDGWHRRTALLCEGSPYTAFNKKQWLTGHVAQPGGEAFQVKAFAVCESSGLAANQAEQVIKDYLNPPVVISESIVSTCIASGEFDLGLALEEAGNLRKVNRDEEAVACYQNIVSVDKDGAFRRQAYYELGLMYELGIGVQQNDELSKMYYEKWQE